MAHVGFGHLLEEEWSGFEIQTKCAPIAIEIVRSYAALEAMGCGIPVVASESGGLKDFVVGSLSAVGDFKDIADQIITLLEMPEDDYRKICDASLKKAHEYTWDRIVDQRVKIYHAVV